MAAIEKLFWGSDCTLARSHVTEVVFDSIKMDKLPKWMDTIGAVKLTVKNYKGMADCVSDWFGIGDGWCD